jgi:transcription initiation factor IIE alpha subunit
MGIVKDTWDIGEKVLQLLSKRRERSNVEKIVSVMTPGRTWRSTELASLSEMNEGDALKALRLLEESDMVICLDVDEEPKGTLWRRL